MKVVLVALLALAVCVFAQNTGDSDFISSFNRHGWDVIFANNTSFLSKIQYHNGVIFVSGEGNVREINENPFEISWHHRFFRQHYRYLDFQAFVHNNLTWVFGPVEAGAVDFMDDGANHPLQIANFTDSDTAVSQSTAGTQIAAVAATDMDDHVVVYGIGWDLRGTGVNNDPRADLTVWRIFVHPMHTQYHNGSFISGNNVTEFYDDRVPLNSGNYTEFTRTYKPWIFHSSYHEHVIVVDPATKMVYQLFAPNHTNSEFKGKNNILSKLPSGFSSNNVTAAHYDHPSGILYVATKSDGIYPGAIVAIDTVATPMRWLWEKTLDMYESNPKAIDIRGDVLYAGLNGGSVILKLDLKNNGKTLGYVTLPWYLREIASIHAGGAHIYIVTHEQYAKVARTLNENVCPTPCDFFYGFCNNGKCECDKSHTLNPKNNRCEPNYNVIDSYHSGEVAMGILFALCFIAAAAGWYVVYRVKQGKGLPPILGATGRYSLVNGGEERHGFLGSDE